MNKKGFTLVEILAVIVLLGVITLIAFPRILETIDRTNGKVDKGKLQLLYQGTERYIQAKENAYPKLEGNVFCIEPQTLLEEKYIDYEDLPGDSFYVVRTVVDDNGKLTYSFVEKTDCIEKGVIAANLGEIQLEIGPIGYAVAKEVTVQYPVGNGYAYSYSTDKGTTWKKFNDTVGDGKLKVTFKNNGYFIARVKREGINGYKSKSATITQIDKTPIGTIVAYAGYEVPRGYLQTDGSGRSRKAYASLYKVIGNNYGTTSDTTTFALPDIRGKVIVGQDIKQDEFSTTGQTGGTKTETININTMPSHTHTFVGTTHNHIYQLSATFNNNTTLLAGKFTGSSVSTNSTGAHTHKSPYQNWTGIGEANTYWYVLRPTGYSSLGSNTAFNSAGGHTHSITPAGTISLSNTTHTHTATITGSINSVSATGVNSNTGGGKSHNNIQPYNVLNYMIKYQ